jgi:hypothetical protein
MKKAYVLFLLTIRGLFKTFLYLSVSRRRFQAFCNIPHSL